MSSAWAAVLVSALGISGVALGAVVRLTARWTLLEARINALADRVTDMLGQMREDRAATNTRLTYLERRLYARGRHEDRGD